jgi:hypothetical protein
MSLLSQPTQALPVMVKIASEKSQVTIEVDPVEIDDSSSDTGSQSSGNGLGIVGLPQFRASVPHITLETRSVSHLILDIVFEYALNKFDDSKERLAAGEAKFLAVIDEFVKAGKPVDSCLPAFPFKSANKVYKVLGDLPDKAEELALERLNTMCVRIKDVYKPGARVTIISDGITYNGMAPQALQSPDNGLRTAQVWYRARLPDVDSWLYPDYCPATLNGDR